MLRLTLIAILVMCATVTCAAISPPTARVTLRAESTVQPARVVAVRDVAQVSGPSAVARKIGDVMIAVGPLPGMRRSIASSYIKLRLDGSDIAAKVTVSGPDKIDLVGSCVRWSTEQITKAAEELATASLPQDGSTYEVNAEKPSRELVTAAGKDSQLQARLLSATIRPGPNTVAVDALVDGKVVTTASMTIRVRRIAEVLTAVVPIRQGEALTEQNTAWSRLDVGRTVSAIVRTNDREQPAWVARRTINTGAILTSSDVTLPPTVKRGDTVILIVKCGGVRLVTTGEVKQDRQTGEMVAVKPAVSDQNVTGRVVEPGLVEVVR